MRRLKELVGVDRRSLECWRRWWREIFTATPFWQNARAAFMPPVDEDRLLAFGSSGGTTRTAVPISSSWSIACV
jgi:hypothetical protein